MVAIHEVKPHTNHVYGTDLYMCVEVFIMIFFLLYFVVQLPFHLFL